MFNQGCSTNTNQPINQPSSAIKNLTPATVIDATATQPIHTIDISEEKLDTTDLSNQQINASDVIYEDGKTLGEPTPGTEVPQEIESSEIKNMSDTDDFIPKPKSYWM